MAVETRLDGKVAIITGGGRGIGKAIARLFSEAGATCIIASRKLENLQRTAVELEAFPGPVHPLVCHVGRSGDIDDLVDRVVSDFSTVDILVNNAATNIQLGSALEASDEQFTKMLEVNVLSCLRLCRKVAPLMVGRGSGSIINVSSVSGLVPQPQSAFYSLTKAALNMLTRSLAQELGPRGVRVNALAPGLVQTDFSSYLWKNEARRQEFVGQQMLPGLAVPEDIAPAALFLASEQARFITGQIIVVDGGATGRRS